MKENKQTFFQRMAELADAYGDPDVKLTTSQRITGALSKGFEEATLGKLGKIGRAISTSFRSGQGEKEDKKTEKTEKKEDSDTGRTTREAEAPRSGGEIKGDDIVVAIERSKSSLVIELKNLDGTFRTGLQSVNSSIRSQSAFLNNIEDYSEDSYLILENIYELLSMMRGENRSSETPTGKPAPEIKPKPKEEESSSILGPLLGLLGLGAAGAGLRAATRGARGAGGTGGGTGGSASTAGKDAGTGAKGASAAGRAAGAAGKAIPLVGGVVSGGLEYAESGNILKSIFVGGSSALGAIGGGIVGTAAGPVGTAAGGVAGGMAGAEVGGGLYDYLFGPSDKEKDSKKESPINSPLMSAEEVSRETKSPEGVGEKTSFSSDLLSFSAVKSINYEAKEINFLAEKINMPGMASRQIRGATRVEEQEETSVFDKIANMMGFGGEEKEKNSSGAGQEQSFFSSLASTISSAFASPSDTKPSSYGFAKAGTGSYISPNQGTSASGKMETGVLKNVTVSRGVDNRVNKSVTDKLSSLQSSFGKRLTITSGFRDPKRNKGVGGASNSAHMRGSAVDVRFDGGVEETIKLINMASKTGFGGIGVYKPGLVHLDTEGKRAWGPSYRYESVPEWAKEAIDAHLGKKGSKPQENMMASVEAGSRSMGESLSTPSGETVKASSSFVSPDISNMISDLSSETTLNTAGATSPRMGGNIFNSISNMNDTNQTTERFSSKTPLPAIDVMFQKLFDSSGMF